MKRHLFLCGILALVGTVAASCHASNETSTGTIIYDSNGQISSYDDFRIGEWSENGNGFTYYLPDVSPDGIGNIDDSGCDQLLVNKWNPIPDDFSVELIDLWNGHKIDKRAYANLIAMLDAARAEGLSPIICSSYRTNEKQQTLYQNKVNSYLSQGYTRDMAEIEAGKWVAVPGASEHQTGLAVDIVAWSYQMLDEQQENTAEQKWLMNNSYKYGFILRYPGDKSEITGIYYEPWHYRYVGVEAATEMFKQDICFEEYIENRHSSQEDGNEE